MCVCVCVCVTVAVVVAFFVCWAPFHAQRLIVMYVDGDTKKWTSSLMALQNVLYFSSGIFYYISSVINPILYNIMSLKFRQAFRNTILRPCRRRHAHRRTLLKRYRFHSKLPGTDTNLTLVHQQANGYGKCAHKLCPGPNHIPDPDKLKYTPGRPCGSGDSGGGSRSGGGGSRSGGGGSRSGSSPRRVPSPVPSTAAVAAGPGAGPECSCIEECNFGVDNEPHSAMHSYHHASKPHVTNYSFRPYHSYA